MPSNVLYSDLVSTTNGSTGRRIFLIDDEQLVLDSLETLLTLETEHETHAFTSPRAALDAAEAGQVDVVISDFFMPEMDGIACLTEFRRLHPAAPRILLTGYADKDSAIRAINQVGLFQYLEKPWNNDDLLLVLRNAVERKELLDLIGEQAAEIEARSGALRGIRKDILRTLA